MKQKEKNKDKNMTSDRQLIMEIEEENLKKTMAITKGIMEAAESDVFSPKRKSMFQKSLEDKVKYESNDRKI
jgi:hypothetical protein